MHNKKSFEENKKTSNDFGINKTNSSFWKIDLPTTLKPRSSVNMKRKRYQTEETCQSFNDGKKFRLNETDLNSEQHYDSILDVSTISQKEEFVLTREIVEHEIISDISGNKWRIGKATGKGSFGEIFLVSDDITKPVNVKNSNYVIKIEPHSNGKLISQRTLNFILILILLLCRTTFRRDSLFDECQ